MARRGFIDLEEARKQFDDPSIQAGRSVKKKGLPSKKPSASERFKASQKFREGQGLVQTLDTTPIGGAVAEDIAPTDTTKTKTRTAGAPGVAPTKGLTSLREFQETVAPEGEVSAVERAVGSKQGTGGFAFHQPGKGGGAPQPIFKSGLPTDRLPSFSELGGAIGSVFKFVSDLSKFNRARGLTPGTSPAERQRTAVGGGLKAKDILSTLTKQQETAILAGKSDEAEALGRRINAIIEGEDAGAFTKQADLDAINEL